MLIFHLTLWTIIAAGMVVILTMSLARLLTNLMAR